MADKTDPITEAVVRRGTVVWGGSPTKYVDSGQTDARGRVIYNREPGEKPTHAGPGDTVRLPASEVKRLRATGALVDPAGATVPTGLGPSYDLIDGKPAPQVNPAT